MLSPGQTYSQVNANRRKFAKPELPYGLAKGGQTRFAKSRKFHDLQSTFLCVDLHWVAKRWKTYVDLCSNLSSTKVNASGWPNETPVGSKSKTYVALRRLASPFGQGFRSREIVESQLFQLAHFNLFFSLTLFGFLKEPCVSARVFTRGMSHAHFMSFAWRKSLTLAPNDALVNRHGKTKPVFNRFSHRLW